MKAKRLIYMFLGFVMVGFTLYTFINPNICESGCGALTEPVFTFLHWAVGPWGPRLLLSVAAVFFFWAGATTRE